MPTPQIGVPTFGAGRVFATANVTNPTPARALTPQSQKLGFKRKVESLYGEKQIAVAVGAGEMEVTGSVEFSKPQPRFFADILFGDAGTAGSYLQADGESGTVPGTTAYVVTAANATNFLFDLGVVNVTTGVLYTCVQSGSEVAGASYSVVTSGMNKGKYTFAAGDANANVSISYAYTSSTIGETIVLSNQLQGLTGNFQAVHVLPWGTQQDMFVFYNCLSTSMDLSQKNSGFGSNTMEYMAAANSNDQLGVATFAFAA